jgi:hypothetical protein
MYVMLVLFKASVPFAKHYSPNRKNTVVAKLGNIIEPMHKLASQFHHFNPG